MTNVLTFSADDGAPPPPTLWTTQARDRDESRMDCETAASLRCHLRADFETAPDWAALVGRLAAKGFELAFDEGRLGLVHRRTGIVLCTCRFLGYGLPDLVARLGKPQVDAATGRIICRPRLVSG